jgi:hypothetical protein
MIDQFGRVHTKPITEFGYRASKPVQKFISSRSSLESANVHFLCVFALKNELTKQSISLMLVVWVSSQLKELSMKARITEKRSSGADIVL